MIAALGLVLLVLPAAVGAQERFRCGTIDIVGNDRTYSRIILRAVNLYPGQMITERDLRRAEVDLERLGFFHVDPGQGVRPTVTAEDPAPGSEFRDILVRVKELP